MFWEQSRLVECRSPINYGFYLDHSDLSGSQMIETRLNFSKILGFNILSRTKSVCLRNFWVLAEEEEANVISIIINSNINPLIWSVGSQYQITGF